jgi:hypothetical protein
MATKIPLANYAGTTKEMSAGDVIPAANGGTGISSPGAAGYMMSSDGSKWVSSAPKFVSSVISVSSTTTAGNITATAAQLVSGYLVDGATQTADFTVTTDTAANILAAMPNASVGTSFTFRLINNDQSAGGRYASLAAGNGVTISTTAPNRKIPKGGFGDYLFTFTSVGSSPAVTVTCTGEAATLGLIISSGGGNGLQYATPDWGGSFTGGGNNVYGDAQNILVATAPSAVSGYTFGSSDARIFSFNLTTYGTLSIRFPQGAIDINTQGSANGGIRGKNVQSSNSTTLSGTTAGNILWTMPFQGVYKSFAAYANGYENNSTTNQTITFPVAFANTPVITTNTTGLSLSVSTTALTITAPNNTTTYSGLIKIEGL